MNPRVFKYILMAAVLTAGVRAWASDLTVRASLDRQVVGVNQQFSLNVELSGEGAGKTDRPELPDMNDFAVYLGSGTSQNIQFVNGRMSSSIVYAFHFQAVKTGRFTIGPVVVNHGGKTFKTEPLDLEVQQSPATPGSTRSPAESETSDEIRSDDLFLRVIPGKTRVYRNEPVFLTYKLYTRVNVSTFSFDRLPGTAGFWVEDYPLDRQPQTSVEVIDGRQYTTAVVKRMVLFPMTTGRKIIEPMSVTCEVQVRNRRSGRSLFDSFFDDSFFGRSVRKAVQSDSVLIEVLPLPEEGKPEGFQGAVGRYRMQGRLDKSQTKTHEAVTYVLEITGEGNVKTLSEPVVTFPPDFEVYPPKISETVERKAGAVTGTKRFEWVLVPRIAGQGRIPSVTMSYFDPESKRYHTVTVPERILQVSQGEEPAPVVTGLSKQEVRLLGQDIRFIKLQTPKFYSRHRGIHHRFIFWLAVFLPLPGLAAAVAVRRRRNRLERDVAYARSLRAGRAVRRRLSGARRLMSPGNEKAFFAEVSRALYGYIGDKLNLPEAGLMTEEIKNHLKNRGVEKRIIDDLLACLRQCDMRRFSPASADAASMESFHKQALDVLNRLDRALIKRKDK